MNYINSNLLSVIAPTDSRRRNDMRFYEEGEVDQADIEKIRLEVEQRKRRKVYEDAHGKGYQPPPMFFIEKPHRFIPDETEYEFI